MPLNWTGPHNRSQHSRAVPEYLRWLKSVYRRLREDISNHRYRQAWWAQGVSISHLVTIRLGSNSSLTIGKGSLIGAYTILDLLSDPLATTPFESTLRIGERTAINEFNCIRAAGGEITIGDNCMISQFVSIVASNHSIARGSLIREQPWDTESNKICIGDDVWIGTHAVILPGVTIGTGSVIGAGAVVTSEIPSYAVAAGIPAEVIRLR